MPLSEQEIIAAVSYNSTNAESIGWHNFRLEIGVFLGLIAPFTEEAFAQAVADWQEFRPPLSINGQLDAATWRALKISLNWGAYLISDGEKIGDPASGSAPIENVMNWLSVSDEGRDLVFYHPNPLPHTDGRNRTRQISEINQIIFHETAGWGGNPAKPPGGTEGEWSTGVIGAHFKIESNGRIVQHYDINRILYHAGLGLNDDFGTNSIGIEFSNRVWTSNSGSIIPPGSGPEHDPAPREIIRSWNGRHNYIVPTMTQMEGLLQLLQLLEQLIEIDFSDAPLWRSFNFNGEENMFKLNEWSDSEIDQTRGQPGFYAHIAFRHSDGWFQNLCMFLVFVKGLDLIDAYNTSKALVSSRRELVKIPVIQEWPPRERVPAVSKFDGNIVVGTWWGLSPLLKKATNVSFWEEVSNEISGRVNSVAVDGRTLLVGGDFTISGRDDINKIARWDGNNWLPVVHTIPENFWVRKILKNRSGFWVILDAHDLRQCAYSKIWQYSNGLLLNAFSEEGLFSPFWSYCTSSGSTIRTIVNFNNTWIIAGRLEVRKDELTVGFMLAKWNKVENTWEDVEGFGIIPPNDYGHSWINTMLVANNLLYFAGSIDFIKTYNGEEISNMSEAHFDGSVHVLHNYRGQIYVGGNFTVNGDPDLINIVRWNNGRWERVVQPDESISTVYDITSDSSGIYIVGDNALFLFIEHSS